MGLFFYKARTMGILVRKRQEGGSLFDIGEVYMGEDAFSNFLDKTYSSKGGSSRGRSGYRGSSGRYGKTATEKETASLTGALPSDIKYYQDRKNTLKTEMETMVKEDANATSSPDYKSKMQEYYKLETEFLPQMKLMSKTYSTSKTAFGNAKAGDAPAIAGNEAVVFDKGDKTFGLVNIEELVRNAPKYQLLSASEVLTARQDNPQFSGFTDLGQKSMQIINNAYGQASFDKFVKDRVKSAGYYKDNSGKWVTPEGQPLSLQGQIKEGGKSIKTNAYNLNMLMDDILSNTGSNANTYVRNLAVRDLYNQSRTNNDLYVDAPKEELNSMMAETELEKLNSQIGISLFVDEKKGSGSGSGGGAGGYGGKDALRSIKRNQMAIANATMMKDKAPIEIEGRDKNYVFDAPSAEVQQGSQLIEMGFKKANEAADGDRTKYDEIGDDNEYARRTLKNNEFIQSMKGSHAEITTVDGTPIKDLTTDNNEQFVTIPPNTSLHLVLAPVEVDTEGNEHVNFNSAEKQKLDEAIKKAYDYLEDHNMSREELVFSGGDAKMQQEAVNIANKFLEKAGVKGDLRIKVVAAFDVIYESARDKKSYKYSRATTEEEAEFLNDINDDIWTRRARKTKAFVPLSESFYSNMFSSNAFGADFEKDFTVNEWIGMLKTKNETPYNPMAQAGAISKEDYQEDKAAKKRADGGVISADDAMSLLF